MNHGHQPAPPHLGSQSGWEAGSSETPVGPLHRDEDTAQHSDRTRLIITQCGILKQPAPKTTEQRFTLRSAACLDGRDSKSTVRSGSVFPLRSAAAGPLPFSE